MRSTGFSVWAGIALLFFAGLSFLHFLSLFRVAALLCPGLTAPAAAGLALLWLGALRLLLWAARRQRLKVALGVIFAYAMFVILMGRQVLVGCPAVVVDGHWRDPQGLLTPQAQYLLHNHGEVCKVISERAYRAYSLFALAYFTGGWMLFPAFFFLKSVDRYGQLDQGKARLTTRYGRVGDFEEG